MMGRSKRTTAGREKPHAKAHGPEDRGGIDPDAGMAGTRLGRLPLQEYPNYLVRHRLRRLLGQSISPGRPLPYLALEAAPPGLTAIEERP